MFKDIKNISSRFFVSTWIVFFILLVAYSVYILIKLPELALNLKPHTDNIVPYVSFKMILGLYFFIAVFNINKIKFNKFWVGAIIGIGLLSRIILIPSTPVLEDDYNRYLWDGAVTAHGYNPYVYSPGSAMDLTDDTVPEELHNLANESGEIIKNVNHPHIRTIYPILSQLVFATAYYIAPWEYWSWKILLLAFDFLLLYVLIRVLKKFQLPLIFYAFYWLNPIVIHEFYNAAHMDLLALPFVVLALYFSIKNNTWLAIIFLTLSVGFKLWPVVLLPLILRNYRKDRKQLIKYAAVFVGFVIFFFIPVLLSSLDESLGFIKYAESWVNNSAVYTIFQWLIQQIISLTGINTSCLSCISRWGIVFVYLIIGALILKRVPKDNLQFFNKALLLVATLYL